MKDKKKKNGSKTFKMLKSNQEKIVKKHAKYMKYHDIPLADDQKSLPFLYWIPKMHKVPSKQQYIAASHSCSTKPLSKRITYCFKLIQQTSYNYCNTIKKTRGYNRMWIVNNSVEVLNHVSKCNKKTELRHFQRKKQKTRNESKYFLSKMKCWRSLLKNSWKKFFNSSNSSKLCLSISNRQVKAKQSHLLTLSNLKNPSRNPKPQKWNPFPKIMR